MVQKTGYWTENPKQTISYCNGLLEKMLQTIENGLVNKSDDREKNWSRKSQEEPIR